MIKYAVVDIGGRQYKVEPDKPVLVDFLGEKTNLVCDKVLIMAEGDKVEFGTPYLKDSLNFEVVGTKKDKIRVAKYHAKANSRRVRGQKQLSSIIKLSQKREN